MQNFSRTVQIQSKRKEMTVRKRASVQLLSDALKNTWMLKNDRDVEKRPMMLGKVWLVTKKDLNVEESHVE